MEGLRGVSYVTGPAGTVVIELEFFDPPAAVIDALEYAMLNDLTFAIPGGVVAGSLSPILMKILDIDIKIETDTYDTYGSFNRTYVVSRHRNVRVNARAT